MSEFAMVTVNGFEIIHADDMLSAMIDMARNGQIAWSHISHHDARGTVITTDKAVAVIEVDAVDAHTLIETMNWVLANNFR